MIRENLFLNKQNHVLYGMAVTLIALFMITISGCKHDPYINPDSSPSISNNCDADTVYFQNVILPLLVTNCATSGCHDKNTHKEGVILTDYSSIISTGGINITNPSDSKIYRQLNKTDDDRMPPPPANAFTESQKNSLLTWIEQGAKNNECVENTECDTSNVTFNGSVVPIFENNCYGCHSQPSPAGNIDLKNADDLARIVNNGALAGSVLHQAGYSPMPKGYNMTQCEVRTIVIWANDTVFPGGGGGGGGGNPDPCDPDTTYFQNTVLPLLVSNCATSGCHNQQSHEHGVILTDYALIIQTAEVKPGDPSGSKLYKVLFGGDKRDDDIMPPPPASPFTTEQKQIIYDWISQGALNNSCNSGCDTSNVTFSGTIWPLMQTWCTGCHSGSNAGGNIHIENYNDVVAIANNGKLMGTVSHAPGYVPMPKNGDKFSDCQIAEIRIWIENGTPNN